MDDVPVQDLFSAAPLAPNEASQAFPLVRMFDPGVSLRDWLAFARRWGRRRPDRGGIIAVRDRRGVVHALFSYVVDWNFRMASQLRIADLIVARLPGAAVDRAVLSCAQDLARRLGCGRLLIEMPVVAADAEAIASLGGVTAPGSSPAAVTFLHRAAGPGGALTGA